ncbi:MAG: TraB/GumN family protein [Bacteroidales bacterium]|nr:TraB/GumN family protein [Bacteroidales bacterium]
MKRLLLLCFLFAIGSIHSQASLRSMTPELDDALLWEISGNGLTNSSFLYGTFHTMNGTFLDSVPNFYASFSKVKQVVAEVDMVNQEIISPKPEDIMSYYMPKDTTYQMLFSNKDYKFVDSCLTTKIQQKMYSVLKPAYTSFMYTLLSTTNIKNSDEGLDKFIMTKAKQNAQKVVGLETMEEHMKLVYGFFKTMCAGSVKDQADLLLFELRNPELSKETMDEMESLYRRQMLSKLMEPSQKMEGKIKEFFPQYSDEKVEEASEKMMADLVDVRNDNWLKKIPAIIKENPSLIIVGALHLTDEKGLINLLRKMGYTVKPVK